jgi:uncharacterized protein YdaU (DUF1376 family)
VSDATNTTKLWMPIYVADYLADTCRLTTEQHGAYLLLIFDYWRNGALPDDDAVLAQVCRLTADAWSMHSAVLKAFFTKADDGLLHQKRIDVEIAKAQLNRSMSVTRARKAAEARWSKNAPSIASSIAPTMLEECPSPSPTPLKTKAKAASVFVLPDWVDSEAWAGYVEMRQKLRKPLTDRAKTLAIKELEGLRGNGQDPVAVLNKATMKSWMSLYPASDNGTPSQNARNGQQERAPRHVNPAAAYSGPEYSEAARTTSAGNQTRHSFTEAA